LPGDVRQLVAEKIVTQLPKERALGTGRSSGIFIPAAPLPCPTTFNRQAGPDAMPT